MTEPTDNELDIVLSKHWPAFATMGTLPLIWTRAAFREAIAKWGTPPSVAGEPVAELSVDRFTTQLLALPASHDVRPYGLHKLYTAPQPAQAQAGAVPMYRLLQSGVDRIEAADEFLSDDATTWAIDPNGIFVGNIYGGHVLRPARRRIKGGHHGIE